MAGAHILVGVMAELASVLLLEDSLSVLEQVAELDGMLGASLCSWLDGRLVQLPSSETGCSSSLSSAFFQEAAGSCLAEKSFLIFFFFFGTGRSFRKTVRLGTPPSSLSLITAREEVVITTHLAMPHLQVKSELGNMHAAQGSISASAGHGYPAGTQGRMGTAVPASCYGS